MRDKGLSLIKGCIKKKNYLTEYDANQGVKENILKYNNKLRAYKCPHCLEWHLTSLRAKDK